MTNKSMNTKNYESHYSESSFWNKVKQIAKKVGINLVYPALLLFYEMKSPNVPLKAKATIVGALGYLICPVDLICDGIPIVGYTDDYAALIAALRTTMRYVTPDVRCRAMDKLHDLFGDFDENAIYGELMENL